MLRQIDTDIWTVDGPEVVFAGAPMHTRMTLVRMRDGRLWVHSPIALGSEVAAFVAELGNDVAALIAPNKFHHLFVEEWRAAFPEAQVFAERDVAAKVPSLAAAEILTNDTPTLYADDVDQVVFGGNRLFQEVVFFHKSSRSAIFTDLLINLKPDGIPLHARLFLRFEGVIYPNGGVPRLYRWLTSDKATGRAAAQVLNGWRPQRLLFCHGEALEGQATDLLAREFGWLSPENE